MPLGWVPPLTSKAGHRHRAIFASSATCPPGLAIEHKASFFQGISDKHETKTNATPVE